MRVIVLNRFLVDEVAALLLILDQLSDVLYVYECQV